MLWSLLAVYAKHNYGLSESLYGWLPTTNALMCVFVQFFVTQFARRFRPLPVMTVGMLLYALGVGSVALMAKFLGILGQYGVDDLWRTDAHPRRQQIHR